MIPLRAPLLGFLCAACLASRERPDALAEVARATGETIEFRTEGLPVDEAELTGGTLTLAEAVRRALRSDPGLQAALARVRAAEAAADQARLLPNPILDVVLRFPEGGGGTEVDAGISTELLSVLTRPRRARAAEDELAGRVAEAVSVALDVVAGVEEGYAAAQAGDELAALARERRALLGRLLEVARERHAAGEGTRADVTALEARAVELELEVEERETAARRARLALALRIGQPSMDTRWALEPGAERPDLLPTDEAFWFTGALELRPEIQALRWRLAALGEEAGLARAEVLAPAELGLALEREDGESLGPAASAPLPLFDAGSARRRKVAAAVQEARAELVAAQRAVVAEVRRALLDLESAQTRLAHVQERLLPIERERRDQVEQAFVAGQVDVTALLLAEQGLQAALARRVELAAELATAWSRLERAVGGPVRVVEASDG